MTRIEQLMLSLTQIRCVLERLAIGLERSNALAERMEEQHQAWRQAVERDSAPYEAAVAKLNEMLADDDNVVVPFPPKPPAA